MLGFFRCAGAAVAEKGVAGLVGDLVPGGQYIVDIAGSAWKKWREKRQQQQLRDEVQQMAAATFEEAREAAREVAREVAAGDPKLQLDLELYLTQIPAAVRQSLKRPDDLFGTTVPADFVIQDEDDVVRLLPPRMPRFRPGDAPAFLRGWVLEEQVGAGGFGEVWRGRNRRATSLTAAFKFGHSLSDRDLSLLHEGDVLNRVMAAGRHPGIVTLEDVWADGDDLPWLRFEFIAGGDLTGLIHGWQKLPPAERLGRVVAALRGLAETVGYFHRLNPAIVHRDLKPSNILVDAATGKLKVADFGIGAVSARRLLDGEMNGSVSRGGRLQSYLRGSHTPLYASPQQRAGSRELDPRDDVHALGVMAYQMLTGRLDLGAGPDFADDLRENGAPEGLVTLLGRCVAQKPDRRPKDALELAVALAAFDGKVVDETPFAEPIEEPSPSLSKPTTRKVTVIPPAVPPTVVAKRSNVVMPKLPPGITIPKRIPVVMNYLYGTESVRIESWLVSNGAIVGIGNVIANIYDGSRKGVIISPATGVISDLFTDTSYQDCKKTVAMIDVIGTAVDDWSAGAVDQPPRPAISITRAGDGIVYPGDHAWVHLVVENTGRGDLVQVSATVSSQNAELAKWRAIIGRVTPGKKVDLCLATILPHDTPRGKLYGELVFHEGNGFPIPTRPLVFTVHPLPRPDFTTLWKVVNGGTPETHGNGDGKPKRGEYVDLAVTVHNQTGEDFEWLFLTLHPKKLPTGTRITAPRGDLGPVKDGETAEGRVSFAVEPNGQPGPATFELRVESTDGRTFAVETVEIVIG